MTNKIRNINYFNKNGRHCLIRLGVKANPFPESEIALEVINSKERGVMWEYEGKRVEILDDYYVSGYPSTDLNAFVAIYPLNSTIHPPPGNSVIYNADGSLYLQLIPPQLISKHALERLDKSKINKKEGMWFENARWNIDSAGKTVTTMWIGFDREWFEERTLNPETGEFGECLGSGRL